MMVLLVYLMVIISSVYGFSVCARFFVYAFSVCARFLCVLRSGCGYAKCVCARYPNSPYYLQYCSTVWHFCSARNCDKLESLNKRALRIVFNDKVSSYQQLLHKSEGSTLYNRRIHNMLITIYKCLTCDSFPKYLKNMFTLRQSEYSFRKTNILSLCKPVTSTYGLNSFRYFASKNWNSLPNNVRSESTLSGFRRLLKPITF